jgi:hypothetical protein
VLLHEFNDISKVTEDWDFLVFFELKLLLFPGSLDHIELALNFGLLLSTVDELSDLFCVSVELELDQVL